MPDRISTSWRNQYKKKVRRKISKYILRSPPRAGRNVVGRCRFTNDCPTEECSTGPTSAVRASTNQLFKRFEVIGWWSMKFFSFVTAQNINWSLYFQVMHPCPHRKFTPTTFAHVSRTPKKTESKCIRSEYNGLRLTSPACDFGCGCDCGGRCEDGKGLKYHKFP